MLNVFEFGIETHKGFVNAWECDENDHLNIQFYWKRFGEACKIFQLMENIPPNDWHDRHVRYHRELRMGANTIVRSAWIEEIGGLLHFLIDVSDGEISATALDTYSNSSSSDHAVMPDHRVPRIAQPKSLHSAPLVPEDTVELIKSGAGMISNRSVVQSAECDANGFLLDQFHISRFSDAASHLWDARGLSRNWLQERNYGGAAVEMKATQCKPVRVGMVLEVVSWVFANGNKTLSFRHQVKDMSSDEVVYCGAATALILDLSARKSISLPSEIIQNLITS